MPIIKQLSVRCYYHTITFFVSCREHSDSQIFVKAGNIAPSEASSFAALNNFAVVVAAKFHDRNSGTTACLPVNWQSRAGRIVRKEKESNFDRVSYTNLTENPRHAGGESAHSWAGAD